MRPFFFFFSGLVLVYTKHGCYQTHPFFFFFLGGEGGVGFFASFGVSCFFFARSCRRNRSVSFGLFGRADTQQLVYSSCRGIHLERPFIVRIVCSSKYT